MREPQDCIGLNETSRDVKFKVYIPAFYDNFGCSYEEHKKYLPCIAILKKQGGDCFYYMTLLTEDGPIESAGYAWFEKTQNIDDALHRKYFKTDCINRVITTKAGNKSKITTAGGFIWKFKTT